MGEGRFLSIKLFQKAVAALSFQLSMHSPCTSSRDRHVIGSGQKKKIEIAYHLRTTRPVVDVAGVLEDHYIFTQLNEVATGSK